ncbi:MAG: SagB/ThcOx family dehydrogenase [Candidatus Melainabacteria bacterium]|nr:SagB/ThcOx family dehydrogenase [Candidatus Melainabacteria bacterium]MBI3309514.1 SagB/ThcOx family dehydrogenase [Candidatus Melainabacteria bacterium]
MDTYQSYAEYYHELTKYTPEGIASNQHRLDFAKQPPLFKEYPTAKNIDLSYLLPLDRNPFSDAGIKNPKDYSKEEKHLAPLSQILYLANGVTAIIPYADSPFYMRAAPSAGGLYPTEIYVLASSFPGLKDGIYNYQVKKHSLALIKEGDFKNQIQHACFDHPILQESNLLLIATGVFVRSSWRYQDRAYRRICLDTGHVIGNINLASYFYGYKAYNIGGFIDSAINSLLELDEEEEQSLAIIPLLPKDQETADVTHPRCLPSRLDSDNLRTPEGYRLIELHNRSKIEKSVPVPDIKFENVEEKFILSPKLPFETYWKNANWKGTLIPTILKRRSTRAFTGEPIAKERLGWILDFAYNGNLFKESRIDPNPTYLDTSIIQTFIAVNNVTGLEEGCYYYSSLGRYLRQVRFKNFREDIYYLCLGQDLGYQASAVIFHTCDLSRAVFKYGERAYRYLHLDAGHIGQRINLAAINLQLGVSGIGGFFDNQVNELLGIPEHEVVIYITVLGVPAQTNN